MLGAQRFNPSGTATLTRGGKGNWYWAIGASLTVDFAAALDQAISEYTSANVNYQQGGTPNGDMSINSATALYLASGANLTAATLGVSESTFGAATTPTVTDLIAPTALALPLGTNIQEVAVLPSNNGLLILDPAQLIVEAIFQTAAGGALHFYGVILDVMLSR
jgi:hypothetical protein